MLQKGELITARFDYLKFKLANLQGDLLPQSCIKIELWLPYCTNQNGPNRLNSDDSARNMWNDDKISIFDIQLAYPFWKAIINQTLWNFFIDVKKIRRRDL